MIIHPGFVGRDVSKHDLNIFDARTGVCDRIANAAPEMAALAAKLARTGDLLVFEATGAYDRRLRAALNAAGARFARPDAPAISRAAPVFWPRPTRLMRACSR